MVLFILYFVIAEKLAYYKFQKTEMKHGRSEPVSLQTELQAYSKDQLSRTIDRLVAVHPQLEAVSSVADIGQCNIIKLVVAH